MESYVGGLLPRYDHWVGTNPSKNENVKETLPALVVNGTQLMNTEGDTVVLHGVSYGWHQFWPRFYNASSVAYLVNDWGAQVLRASWEWIWIAPAM